MANKWCNLTYWLYCSGSKLVLNGKTQDYFIEHKHSREIVAVYEDNKVNAQQPGENTFT